MKEPIYYSRTFPVEVYPKSKKVLKYEFSDFQKAIDTLFRLADNKSAKRYFQKPMNIIVANYSNKLILGINFDKAIFKYNSLGTLTGKLQGNYQNTMQQLAIDELGFNINCFIVIDFKAFDNAFPDLINIFRQYQELPINGAVSYILTPELKLCINSVLKSIKNTFSYGDNDMWVEPIFKARNITVNPNMCFCVLPFNKTRLDILDKLIKPEIKKDFHLNVIKSGDIFTPNQNIMESIWVYINQASFVLVDVSDANPNVFYELGICHTLGKPVITLCDKKSLQKDYNGRLPFDINSINTIFYENSGVGAKEMLDNLKKIITNLRAGKSYIEDSIKR